MSAMPSTTTLPGSDPAAGGGVAVEPDLPSRAGPPEIDRPSPRLVRLAGLLGREAALIERQRGFGFSIWEIAPVLAGAAILLWLIQFLAGRF